MKLRIVLSIVSLLALAAVERAAHAQAAPPHPFGIGLILGEPTGLSGKYYMGNKMALDFAIGDEYYGRYDDGIEIHGDVLWHPAVLTRQPKFTVPFYLGVGARIWDHDYGYYDRNGNFVWADEVTRLGVRAPFGVLMDFADPRIDVFFELAIAIDLIILDRDDDRYDRRRVDLMGGLGIRYYF